MLSKEPKNFYDHEFLVKTFFSPSISSVLERFVIHPLDTVMTFQQKDNTSLSKTLTNIYKNFGVKGFYKGLSFPLIVSAIPMELSLFGAYAGIKKIFKDFGFDERSPLPAVLTGLLVSAVFTPIDAKRIRDTLKIKVENPYHPLCFYRGFVPMLFKSVTHVPIALGGADVLIHEMNEYKHQVEVPLLKELLDKKNPYSAFISGMLTGGAAQLVTTPIDVIKTKFMIDVVDRKRTLFEHAKDAYEQRALFNSLGVRIIRFSLHTGLMIMLIETFNQLLCPEEPSISNTSSSFSSKM